MPEVNQDVLDAICAEAESTKPKLARVEIAKADIANSDICANLLWLGSCWDN